MALRNQLCLAGVLLCGVALGGCSGSTSGPVQPTATKLVFTVQPSNAGAGAVNTPAVQVAVQDAQGNTVTTATTSITVAIGANPPGGTVAGSRTAAEDYSVATFSTLSIDRAGTGYTLTASATGLTGVTSSAFNIGVGAAAKLVFTVQPSNTAAGAAITPAVQVAVQDAQGNPVTTATTSITVAIGTNPASGILSGTTTVAAVNGVATFSAWSLNTVGTGYTLTAAATGLTGATSSAFNVVAPVSAVVARVSAGFVHTCGVTSSGAAYCWGNNTVGELGDGTYGTDRLTPAALSVGPSAAVGWAGIYFNRV